MYLGVVLHHVVHEVAADESAAARDDDVPGKAMVTHGSFTFSLQ